MGTVYKRGKFWWWKGSYNGKPSYRSLKTTSQEEARRLGKILDAQKIQRAMGGLPVDISIDQAVAEFLDRKRLTVKPSTIVRYEENGRTVCRAMGKIQVHRLSGQVVADFVRQRQELGRANQTIIEELGMLKGAVRMLLSDGRIRESPIRDWPRLKPLVLKPETVGHYSHDEVRKLKDFFRGDAFEPVFLFLLYTGTRRGEAVAARVRDIDWRNNTLTIRGSKTESGPHDRVRYVEIHPGLENVLAPIRADPPESPILPVLAKHCRDWPHLEMTRACKELGIPYRRLHGIRHTFISSLLAAGVPVRSVMAMVGHKNFQTTLRYSHVSQEDLKGKISRLDY